MQMRPLHSALVALAGALPLAIAAVPAQAQDQNGLLGQAQRFLNGGNSNQGDAYEKGREDERRREQAARERHHDEARDRADRRGDAYDHRVEGRTYDNGGHVSDRPYRPTDRDD